MKSIGTAILLATPALAASVPAIAEAKTHADHGMRLVSTAPGVAEWVTEDAKARFLANKTKFLDITESSQRQKAAKATSAKTVTYPSAPAKQDIVNPLLETLSLDNIRAHVDALGAFHNRYWKSESGAQASQWIVDTAAEITSSASYTEASVAAYNHSFVQNSVIAHIPGVSNGPLTIIGAHMDSANASDLMNGRAPGQDDNASGSANLLEIFRALLASEYAPITPVEVMWYAGEEGGILGSQDIAARYAQEGVEVQAVLNLDMTAYFRPGTEETVALITDYTDAGLTQFLRELIHEYLAIGWTNTECGYACSDHTSWDSEGYPAAFPFEAVLGNDNPLIHGENDTIDIDGFSWEHSLEFTKLGLAYIIELTSG
ncbi:Zn-dependent exopeptidase [Cylindrobasidium torrendii FP15055 ss-10]|uniref:Peptide hydrolase n=1 Tax=Cylindrobasidium torrendii FP15055 ss-10 TaxID=1314674 RepID=A0A0D7AY71_9AGAR|nr:Zn-dependent exopeptidase [Cylindrobasidium torrendii FP15055 ss-10]